MKAIIELDVPEFQIDQTVTIYFPDSMQKHGKCIAAETTPVKDGEENYVCAVCREVVGWDEFKEFGIYDDIRFKYCPGCGRKVKWS